MSVMIGLKRAVAKRFSGLRCLSRRLEPAPGATSGQEDSTAAEVKTVTVVYPSARASRPIGIFYDELSRGLNPFSLIDTAGVADITDQVETIVDMFNRFGIVKVRRVYSAEKSRLLNQHCIDFSGLKPLDIRDVATRKKKWSTGGAPVLNDERFWPYAADPFLQKLIPALLGPDCLEFGTAVAAHYSARGLHRDYRMLVEKDGSAYSIKNPEKRIVRILHYCGSAGGALGYIPFSHDETAFARQARRIGLTHPTEWFDRHRQVLTNARLKKTFFEADEIERHVCWVHADPGDIIVSNSAMLHCGEYLTAPRYFFVSTYAQSNAETLPLAVSGARTEMAQGYYRYMADMGFPASRTVLDAVNAA